MIAKEIILSDSAALYDTTVSVRRHLHAHPELSFEERETSDYVAHELEAIGIPFKRGFGAFGEQEGHGIVAYIECGNAGRTVALRADMDALPVTESESHACRSECDGVMHACGHDLHTASLLTTARILWKHRAELAGRFVLIFQPGEETWPGGASLMLKEGALECWGCKPDVVVGAHVLAEMPVGHIGFREGHYMASGDEIHIHVRGTGGHGGMPHLLTDNVLVGCETVVAMQHLVAREVPATVPMVLSFGKFEAKGATNVIPDTVYMAGTMRTMNEEWRARMKERITTVAKGIAQSYRAEADVEIRHGYPCVRNDESMTQRARSLTAQLVGPDGIEEVKDMALRMTAEDFGYYTVSYPAVFYRFGVGSAAGAHTPDFEPDERALRTSPAVMAWIAIGLAQ